jgi:hypothetical protein
MQKQGNMTPPKEHSNSEAIYSGGKEINDLPEKEFKIMRFLRKLNDMQENTNR